MNIKKIDEMLLKELDIRARSVKELMPLAKDSFQIVKQRLHHYEAQGLVIIRGMGNNAGVALVKSPKNIEYLKQLNIR